MQGQPKSLGGVLKHLLVVMDESGIPMPIYPGFWHGLVYDAKKNSVEGRPDCLDDVRFDWDGPHPTSQYVSELMDGMSIAGALRPETPGFRRYSLDRDVAELWKKELESLDTRYRKFLEKIAEEAKQKAKEAAP